MPSFGLGVHLELLILHKIVSAQKLYKSHVINF
jgi:hypothetical protein